MYATSVFYSQTCPPLLLGGQFPNLAGVYPLPASWEHWLVQKARSPVCSGQKRLLRDSASGSAMTLEETLQLRETLSRGARRRPRMEITMAEDQAI
jgi:hypothetical protein